MRSELRRVKDLEYRLVKALDRAEAAWDRYVGDGWPAEVVSGQITHSRFLAKELVEAITEWEEVTDA